MHARTGAGWLYATAVILAANAITSRIFNSEIAVAPVVAMLLAILVAMFGVHLDHRNYLAQQRAKRHHLPRDLLGRHSPNRAAKQQFSDVSGYRERMSILPRGVFRVELFVQFDLMPAKKPSGLEQADDGPCERRRGKVKASLLHAAHAEVPGLGQSGEAALHRPPTLSELNAAHVLTARDGGRGPADPTRLMAAPMARVQFAEMPAQPGETSGTHAGHGGEHGPQHHAVVVVGAAQRDVEGSAAGVSNVATFRARAAAARQIQPTLMLPFRQGRRCRRTAPLRMMPDGDLLSRLIYFRPVCSGDCRAIRPSYVVRERPHPGRVRGGDRVAPGACDTAVAARQIAQPAVLPTPGSGHRLRADARTAWKKDKVRLTHRPKGKIRREGEHSNPFVMVMMHEHGVFGRRHAGRGLRTTNRIMASYEWFDARG